MNHVIRLIHSNSAWWSRTCWAPSLSGAVEETPPQLSPQSPPAPHFPTPLASPVQCRSPPGTYPQDTPHCRFWRSPRLASPWTRAARRRSVRCSARRGGAWASRPGSGCCSRRSRGYSPAAASARSTSPPGRRTGSDGGCCWTNQAHAGTAGLQKQLNRKRGCVISSVSHNESLTIHHKLHVHCIGFCFWRLQTGCGDCWSNQKMHSPNSVCNFCVLLNQTKLCNDSKIIVQLFLCGPQTRSMVGLLPICSMHCIRNEEVWFQADDRSWEKAWNHFWHCWYWSTSIQMRDGRGVCCLLRQLTEEWGSLASLMPCVKHAGAP